MTVRNGAFSGFGTVFGSGFEVAAKRLVALLNIWAQRRRDRRALIELDDRLLRDIGLDRLAARREAERPFWDGGEPGQ